MTMQRRHFEFIADTVRDLGLQPDIRAAVAMEFALKLNRTNANFDRARFLKACGVEER